VPRDLPLVNKADLEIANLCQGVKAQPKMIWYSNTDFPINPDSDPDVRLPDRFQNVVDALCCQRQSFRRVS